MLIITNQSYAARQQREATLKNRKRVATELKAEDTSDKRENGGFQDAVATIKLTNRQLGALELDRNDLMFINPLEWTEIDMMGEPNAQVGAVVTIERSHPDSVFVGSDHKPSRETHLIGGAWDNDLGESPAGLPARLSYISPLARLLIPHDVGFKGFLESSGELIRLIDARPPTVDEIKAMYPTTPEKKKPTPQPSGMGMEM